MMKVGLTGGYASGKSFVASQFERLGCHLIYADKLGHQVLEPGHESYQQTINRFGSDILKEDGLIDRRRLASVVFEDKALLDALNAIVHPAVFRLEEKLFEQFAFENPHGIAMVEAAILIETGRFKAFDRLIVVVCDGPTQIARGMKRDGISREEAMARIARQLPFEEKKAYAHYLINTSGPREETVEQVEGVYRVLKALAETSVLGESRQ